ncbi:glycosyl transferase family 2 [Croceivirga lutea]|uniref:TIGR04283 family arsenosugar biosynthesis glycosyltransferase n=1 Tax=Croceivirga lutea TaxID=1775167 RepID=UPI001639ABD9|nr:TIGR04283 family arsenosugar biosynthesis glycosyltransferase [Croceivirga lutea]GGG47952.1 glycosyl transferase family 2 [Croceivirga lutea]
MISVIIPAHNEIDNLKELLPTLLMIGEGFEYEVLVCVSCANQDDTLNLNFSKPIQFIDCKKKGRASQMNYGTNLAKGNVFVFMHADVRPPKGFFKDIMTTLESGNEAGFFSYKFDKESFLLNLNASFTKKDGVFTGGGDQCLFIKRKTFEELGRFNEAQVLMEDFEFFKRMKKAKVSYKIVPNELIVSARKYQENSYLRVNLSNLLLVILFKMGFSAEKLKVLHNRLLRLSYQTKN